MELKRRTLLQGLGCLASSVDDCIREQGSKGELKGAQDVMDYPALMVMELKMKREEILEQIREDENNG